MSKSTLDSDTVRIFLATMRTSSRRAAAATLGPSHPTVRRRLDQLGSQLGVALSEHHPQGLRATAAAAEQLATAEAVEASVRALGRRARAMSPELDGTIRVSMPSLVASHLLMPDLDAFARRWPRIRLVLEPSDRVVDLGRREADVDIRALPSDSHPTTTWSAGRPARPTPPSTAATTSGLGGGGTTASRHGWPTPRLQTARWEWWWPTWGSRSPRVARGWASRTCRAFSRSPTSRGTQRRDRPATCGCSCTQTYGEHRVSGCFAMRWWRPSAGTG